MAEKPETERRVYVLPTEQLERVRAYQSDNRIASEVETVRRLLDIALQTRDTIENILRRIMIKFREENDLRAIARDILINHELVKNVEIDDGILTFILRSGEGGQIRKDGKLFIKQQDDNYFGDFPPSQKRKIQPATDLDEDIPF